MNVHVCVFFWSIFPLDSPPTPSLEIFLNCFFRDSIELVNISLMPIIEIKGSVLTTEKTGSAIQVINPMAS